MMRLAVRLLLLLVPLVCGACNGSPAVPSSGVSNGAEQEAKGQPGPPRPPADTPATGWFRCPGADCTGGDRILGDGSAYQGLVTAAGEFRLEVNDAARRVTVDYRDQLDQSVGRRWFETLTADGSHGILLQTNVVLPGTETEAADGLRSIPVGSTWPARMKLGFTLRSPAGVSVTWGHRFNPTFFPGSHHVSVTRVSESHWIVEATSTETASIRSTADRKHGGEIFEGYYRLPFRLTIIRN